MPRGPSHLDHPFYRPLWRRILIVLVTIGWVLMEATWSPSSAWTMLAGAVCAYSVWVFLIAWRDPERPERPDGT